MEETHRRCTHRAIISSRSASCSTSASSSKSYLSSSVAQGHGLQNGVGVGESKGNGDGASRCDRAVEARGEGNAAGDGEKEASRRASEPFWPAFAGGRSRDNDNGHGRAVTSSPTAMDAHVIGIGSRCGSAEARM